MKKIFAFSVLNIALVPMAFAATPWWQHADICRRDPTTCYSRMGAGYDSELWDTTDKCWGMKYICPDALVSGGDEPVPMGRDAIRRGDNILDDFDTDELNGDCFGVRKTTSNGAMASVDGQYVRVWCNDVPLDASVEPMPNGVIVSDPDAQPTCADLADYGYAAVQNGDCYGKYYDFAKYHLVCGNDLEPDLIVITNGADYTLASGNMPADRNAADALFDKMESVSQVQHAKYFKNN